MKPTEKNLTLELSKKYKMTSYFRTTHRLLAIIVKYNRIKYNKVKQNKKPS